VVSDVFVLCCTWYIALNIYVTSDRQNGNRVCPDQNVVA
jgi:hypothetical protein